VGSDSINFSGLDLRRYHAIKNPANCRVFYSYFFFAFFAAGFLAAVFVAFFAGFAFAGICLLLTINIVILFIGI